MSMQVSRGSAGEYQADERKTEVFLSFSQSQVRGETVEGERDAKKGKRKISA